MCNLDKIVDRCKKGDRKAGEQLYHMFSAKMFAVCIQYSKSREEAEDNLQDGFIKILESIRQYTGKGSFEGWMKRIFINTALEKYRKNHTGPFTLQRYKGLGEMDAEQLWETTLDPERRLLKLVEIEDARMASSVTEMLMGTEVPPRKAFIYENATEAELDI